MADVKELFTDLTEGREVIVNRLLPGPFIGGRHTVLLATVQPQVIDGKLTQVSVIGTRLRFNPEMAAMMRDLLTNMINEVSPPKDQIAH